MFKVKWVRQDCFAYGVTRCRVLMNMECTACSFHATAVEIRKRREAAREKIEKLPYERKKDLLIRYHGHREAPMPPHSEREKTTI